MSIQNLDARLVGLSSRIMIPLARLALGVVYIWFGVLKVVGQSPASELVHELFLKTIPFMDFGLFMILFGLFEMLIGALFLWRKTTRIAFYLFLAHFVTTTMPLVLVSGVWSGFLVPTLEGQYIIKNLLLLSCAVTVFSSVKVPLNFSNNIQQTTRD